jgi:hypothetical protein
LQLSQRLLEGTVQDLNEHGRSCPSERVLVLEKVGISDWPDRIPRKVVIPDMGRGETMHHGIAPETKYISLMIYGFAAEELSIPFIRMSQKSGSIE